MLVGLIAVQVRPLGSGVSESDTVPANPLTGVIVIVEVADSPVFEAAGEEAEIEKPFTRNTIPEVVWDKEPLVPVTVTV